MDGDGRVIQLRGLIEFVYGYPLVSARYCRHFHFICSLVEQTWELYTQYTEILFIRNPRLALSLLIL